MGDIAMAVTAPWIAVCVASDDRFSFRQDVSDLEPVWHCRFPRRRLARYAPRHAAHATPAVRADTPLLRSIDRPGAHRSLGTTAAKTGLVPGLTNPRHVA